MSSFSYTKPLFHNIWKYTRSHKIIFLVRSIPSKSSQERTFLARQKSSQKTTQIFQAKPSQIIFIFTPSSGCSRWTRERERERARANKYKKGKKFFGETFMLVWEDEQVRQMLQWQGLKQVRWKGIFIESS